MLNRESPRCGSYSTIKMARFGKIITFSALFVILFFAAWKIYTGIYFPANDRLENIKCHYMSYACSECYPQWQIDSVFAVKQSLQGLVGKDFEVIYEGKQWEDNYLPDSCAICYDYYFSGSMKRTLSNKLRFKANDFQLNLRNPDCRN
jgi:hypothetical protein